MNDLAVRPATRDDLPAVQAIARRTVDRCYRAFLGNDGVDWYLSSGESDRELARHLAEFKDAFDAKIEGVMKFMESERIPKAVKKALG